MGSGGSSGGGGGSLGGGKTVLAGTFLAEQTHGSNPGSYTLVSVCAASHQRGGPRAQASSGSGAGNRGDRLRKSRGEKGGIQCTKLSALDEIDSLLLPNEESPAPCLPKAEVASHPPSPKAKSATSKVVLALPPATGIPAKVPAQPRGAAEPLGLEEPIAGDGDAEEAEPLVEGDSEAFMDALPQVQVPVMQAAERPKSEKGSPRKLQMKDGTKLPLQSRGVPASVPPPDTSVEAPSETAGLRPASPSSPSGRSADPQTPSSRRGRPLSRPVSQPASSAGDRSEVFKRLHTAHKPWVAERTNHQLLQYLAWRGGTPEIASPTRSFNAGGSGEISVQSPSTPSRSSRRQYKSHRELFDDCLHREASPSPPRDESRLQDLELRSQKSESAGRVGSLRKSGTRPVFSPQRLAKAQVAREQNSRLFDQIEDITVIPQDAVQALLEGEADCVFNDVSKSPAGESPSAKPAFRSPRQQGAAKTGPSRLEPLKMLF